jgi:ribokinase
MQPRICVFGGINIDFFATSNLMPRPGQTVVGDSFLQTGGGKGANQAFATARLGAWTHMIGAVGEDVFGERLINDLNDVGVDSSGIVRVPDMHTGVAMILLDSDKQNYIVQIPGANARAGLTDIEPSLDILATCQVLMLQREVSQEISLKLAREAKKQGITVVWDPAPAPSSLDDALLELLRLADVVTPNETEAEALTGIPVVDFVSAEAAAVQIIEIGAQSVVITMGGQGGLLLESGSDEPFTFQPLPVDIVDTVAAGDAFTAGLAVALAEGQSLTDAVKFGRVSGGLAVTSEGAMISMPTRDQVLRRLTEPEVRI